MAFNEITGTEAGEDLTGTASEDRILALGGNDAVDAFAGDDQIDGGDGDDLIAAGPGNDTVWGGAGDDRLYAGFYGSTDIDTVYGGAGADEIAVFSISGGTIHGGGGFDLLAMNLTAFDTSFALALPPGDGSAVTNPNGLLLSSIEALRITTGRGDDTISGGSFTDHIAVRGGANVVDAGAGDDVIGYIIGAANTIDGGSGIDTLRIEHQGSDALLLTVAAGAVDDGFGSGISAVERFEVFAGTGADQVVLGARQDLFYGRGGADSADGRGGADTLLGGRGDDSLDGGAGDDELRGDIGHDQLQGSGGRDRLHGDSGADTLSGGADRDVLRGGGGADLFVLDSAGSLADSVRDFLSGTDRLGIASALTDAALPAGAIDPARFALDAASGSEAQFVYVAGVNGHLFWDSNGELSGGRSLVAVLYGSPTLAAGDLFIV